VPFEVEREVKPWALLDVVKLACGELLLFVSAFGDDLDQVRACALIGSAACSLALFQTSRVLFSSLALVECSSPLSIGVLTPIDRGCVCGERGADAGLRWSGFEVSAQHVFEMLPINRQQAEAKPRVSPSLPTAHPLPSSAPSCFLPSLPSLFSLLRALMLPAC
jgi:hypothetical protein